MSVTAASGRRLLNQREELGAVGGPSAHLESLVLEQARQPVADECGVVGDHDAHGISATIRVPPPGGLSMVSFRRARRRGRRGRGGRVPRSGLAPPFPSSRISMCALPFSRPTVTQASLASAYFAMFASDSATTK